MSIFIEDEILYELSNFAFKRNSLGYEYLIEAIKIVFENKMAIRDFKKYVYMPIAKKYNTKAKNVQWCIEKLISVMQLNTQSKAIEDYFNIRYYERFSTKAFIIGVARKLEIKKNYIKTIS